MDILQDHLPYTPWTEPGMDRLPGVQPVDGAWLHLDEAYDAQMAYRARLLAERRAAVLAIDPGAVPATQEYLEMVLDALPEGFARQGQAVRCPDGRVVAPDRAHPLDSVNALVQEDVVILQKQGEEHVLTAALLCFPASWTLAEKFLRPLMAIHDPVPDYAGVGPRVQRMFDWIRPGQPLWRANALMYHDADLHQPRRENDRRVRPVGVPRYLRSERQTMLRLPRTQAVAFVIHTYVVPFENLTPAQQETCPFHRP